MVTVLTPTCFYHSHWLPSFALHCVRECSCYNGDHQYRAGFVPNPMIIIFVTVRGVAINVKRGPTQNMKSLKAPNDLSCIMERKQGLAAWQQSTSYQKQRSALEMEFKKFLEFTSQRHVRGNTR